MSGYAFRTFDGTFTALWWAGNLANSSTRWVVPVFVMISGALLLPRHEESVGTFYGRRALRIVPPLLFWPPAYALFDLRLHHRPITAERVVRAAFVEADPYYHLWFLYLIVGLYALTPLLRRVVAGASTRRVAAIAAVAFLPFIEWPGHAGRAGRFDGWLSFVPYLGYYLLGAALVSRKRPLPPAFSAPLTIAALAATILGTRWLAGGELSIEGARGFQANTSPFTIAAACGLFEWVRAAGVRPWLGRAEATAAAAVFGVYLIHPFFIEIFWKAGLTIEPGDSPVSIVTLGLPALAASAACAVAAGRLPIVRRLV